MKTEQTQLVNEIDLVKVKKCFPERAQLIPRRPKEGSRTNGAFAIQVLCEPRMKDKETDYCFESVRQLLPIVEFYSETQGSNIWIYWKYDKNKPVTFNI